MPSQPQTQPQPTADRIRVIAADLFATRGFAATSMREIASATGLTAGALYNHFASKDDILQAIVVDEYGVLLADLTERLAATPGALEQLDELTRGFCDRALAHQARAGTAEREYHHLTQRHRERAAGLRESILALVEATINRGLATKVFVVPGTPPDTRRVARSIVNILVALTDAHDAVEPERRVSVTDLHVELVRRIVGVTPAKKPKIGHRNGPRHSVE